MNKTKIFGLLVIFILALLPLQAGVLAAESDSTDVTGGVIVLPEQVENGTFTVSRDGVTLGDGDMVYVGDELTFESVPDEGYAFRSGTDSRTKVLTEEDFVDPSADMMDSVSAGIWNSNSEYEGVATGFTSTLPQSTNAVKTASLTVNSMDYDELRFDWAVAQGYSQYGSYRLTLYHNDEAVITHTFDENNVNPYSNILSETYTFEPTGRDFFRWEYVRTSNGTWVDDYGRPIYLGNVRLADTRFEDDMLIYEPEPPVFDKLYAVNVQTAAGGSITADAISALAGNTVTLTPVPEEGYIFSQLTVTTSSGGTVEINHLDNGSCSFVMPEDNVEVNAVFQCERVIVLPDQVENGTFTVSRKGAVLSNGDMILVGDELIIESIPNEGYAFRSGTDSGTKVLRSEDFQENPVDMMDSVSADDWDVNAEYEGVATGFTSSLPKEENATKTASLTINSMDYNELSFDWSVAQGFSQYGLYRLTLYHNDVAVITHTFDENNVNPYSNILSETYTFEPTGNDTFRWEYVRYEEGAWADDYGRPIYLGNVWLGDARFEDGMLLYKPEPPVFDRLYTVNTQPVSGGSINVDTLSAFSGDTVTLTLMAEEGYRLSQLTVTTSSGETVEVTPLDNGGYSFVMPEDNVEVNPIFGMLYTVNMQNTIGGSINADTTSALPGDTVTLTPMAEKGYRFIGLTVTDTSGETVEVTSLGDGRYSFVMPEDNVNVNMVFGVLYTVNEQITSGGSITADITLALPGDTVTLTPMIEEGYSLMGLTVTDTLGNTVEVTSLGDGRYSFVMPEDNVEVNAVFTHGGVIILPDQVENGTFTVSLDGSILNDGETVNVGDELTFESVPQEGYVLRSGTSSGTKELTEEDFSSYLDKMDSVSADGWNANSEYQGVATGFTSTLPRSIGATKTASLTVNDMNYSKLNFDWAVAQGFSGYGLYRLTLYHNDEAVITRTFDANNVNPYSNILSETYTFEPTGNDTFRWEYVRYNQGNWGDTGGRPIYLGNVRLETDFHVYQPEPPVFDMLYTVDLQGEGAEFVTLSKTSVFPGEEVTITVSDGYVSKAITVTDEAGEAVELRVSDNTYSFIMPRSNASVSVELVTGFEGAGTAEDPFIIPDLDRLELMAICIAKGEYTDSHYRLTADIDIADTSLMIGTADYPFSGSFDGGGHTITVNYNTTEEYTALFRYIGGAIITDLNTSGTITTSAKFAGGIVGLNQNEPATISRCMSDVDIISTVNGDGTHGGIIGNSNQTTLIDNCGFTGSFTSGTTTCWGGIAGWFNADGTTITNSYVALAALPELTTDSSTFARTSKNIVITNCYYLNAIGTAQGEQKSAEQFAGGEVAYLLNGSVDAGLWGQDLTSQSYPVINGMDIYLVNTGVCTDIYTGYTNNAEEAVNNVTHDMQSNGICACGATCQPAAVTEEGTYQIANPGNLIWFAKQVNAGNSAANAVLTADIDMSGITGFEPIGAVTAFSSKEENIPGYTGSFDGQGHIISNLTLADGGYAVSGLFGSVGGSVANVGLDGFNFTKTSDVDGRFGALCGLLLSGGSIDNCYVINSDVNATTSRVAGIIAGGNFGGSVSHCYTRDCTFTAYGDRCGYVVGDNANDSNTLQGSITDCYTDGSNIRGGGYNSSTVGTLEGGAANVSDEAFASGEITYLLNDGVTDGSQAWYQAIGRDESPVLKGAAVYYDEAGDLYYNDLKQGDVDMNGTVDRADAVLLLKYISGIAELTQVQQELADVNGGGLDMTDVIDILNM